MIENEFLRKSCGEDSFDRRRGVTRSTRVLDRKVAIAGLFAGNHTPPGGDRMNGIEGM